MKEMTLETIKTKALKEKTISLEEARFLVKENDILSLFQAAHEIREHFKGQEVILCSIMNAKSGRCPEECGFCGQSAHYKTSAPVYRLKELDELKEAGLEAYKNGASEFSFVTSGRKLSGKKEIDRLKEAIRYLKTNTNLKTCVSIGLMQEKELKELKEAGLDNFHHNLETARSHFSKIVKSHSYDDEVKAVQAAQSLDFFTCTGGIMGMGETWEQRLELAFDLKKLQVDSVPINYLNPIQGTPLAEMALLSPFEALKIIAIFRFILADKEILVMGGRERVLRDMQSWIFFAGANGMLLGNYLLTSGRSAKDDLKMIKDLGLKVKNCSKVDQIKNKMKLISK